MPKAEISWKRMTDEGVKLQVYVQRVGRDWKFFHREKRYDVWQPVPNPPLEDWLPCSGSSRGGVTSRMTKYVCGERFGSDIRKQTFRPETKDGRA